MARPIGDPEGLARHGDHPPAVGLLPFSDSRWQLDAWVSTYTAIAAGELDGVSDDVTAITGHPATTLEELLRR